mgnify:CR=1 FL=1
MSTYPWDFEYEELYQCFGQMGIAKNGEYCEMEFKYLESKNSSWDIQNYYDCLERVVGVANTDIDCASLDAQALVGSAGKREAVANIKDFTISKNLETSETMVNYSFEESLNFKEKSIISSSFYQFMGYQF